MKSDLKPVFKDSTFSLSLSHGEKKMIENKKIKIQINEYSQSCLLNEK